MPRSVSTWTSRPRGPAEWTLHWVRVNRSRIGSITWQEIIQCPPRKCGRAENNMIRSFVQEELNSSRSFHCNWTGDLPPNSAGNQGKRRVGVRECAYDSQEMTSTINMDTLQSLATHSNILKLYQFKLSTLENFFSDHIGVFSQSTSAERQ